VNKNKILCIYHARCLDGFAAAYALGVNFGFDNVEFLAKDYGDPVPDITDRVVYLVDFSFKPAELRPVLHTAAQVTIIDHHASAIEDWEHVYHANLIKIFDNTKAGSVLTWEYFNPFDNGRPVPGLYYVFQDYDLWQFRFGETSRNVVAGAYGRGHVLNQDFEGFGKMLRDEESLELLTQEGKMIRQSQLVLIHGMLARNTTMIKFMGYDVPLANIPHEFNSVAGEILYKRGHPFAITYDDWHDKGYRKFSLRSNTVDGVDVKALAKMVGGGGHTHAAGFKVPLKKDLSTYIQFLNPL
jgi:oligoribonuclease NrnB/cAMP/cGMP phosphodiesterase (DHH superfamily)